MPPRRDGRCPTSAGYHAACCRVLRAPRGVAPLRGRDASGSVRSYAAAHTAHQLAVATTAGLGRQGRRPGLPGRLMGHSHWPSWWQPRQCCPPWADLRPRQPGPTARQPGQACPWLAACLGSPAAPVVANPTPPPPCPPPPPHQARPPWACPWEAWAWAGWRGGQWVLVVGRWVRGHEPGWPCRPVPKPSAGSPGLRPVAPGWGLARLPGTAGPLPRPPAARASGPGGRGR